MVLHAEPLPVADLVEIEQLYARYNHAVDAGDGEAFASTFTGEGWLAVMGNRPTGSDELAVFARGVPQQVPGIRHVASNVIAGADGDGVLGAAYLVTYRTTGDGLVVVTSGRYDDTLERVDGQWRFASRIFTPDTTA